jgi:quercetin dioxygenase-like cupin family protein
MPRNMMRRLGLLLTIAVSTLGALAAAAIATVANDSGPAGPSGVHITPLSKGTLASSVHAKAAGIEITTNGRKDILITKITVDPGGSFGWHSHPGPVLVAVGKGTLTVYDATKHGCQRSTVTAGDAFIEDGRHVHLARNEGSTPIELNATFLARPGTTEFLKAEPEPPGCNV